MLSNVVDKGNRDNLWDFCMLLHEDIEENPFRRGNFTKFLIDSEGYCVDRFEPEDEPEDMEPLIVD